MCKALRSLRFAAGIGSFLPALGHGPVMAQAPILTIHASQRVASLQMAPEAYASWKADDGFSDEATRMALVKSLYGTFQDAFDFIFLVLNEEERPATLDYSGQLFAVSNQVEGLGLNTFDLTAGYGSSGRLKSVMALTNKRGILYGPSLHELAHNWANFGLETSAYVPPPGAGLYPDFRPHWGITGGSTAGQLGGFRQDSLVSNVDGKPTRYSAPAFGLNANGGNSVPYNQLELYLMGLIPLSGVAPFDVFRDITAYEYQDPKTFYFEAGTRIRYDQARLQSVLGTRSPSHLESQKSFRLLIVALCAQPLTDYDWLFLDKQSESFGLAGDDGTFLYNFWEATGGRATLQVGQLNNALKFTAVLAAPAPRRPLRGAIGLDGVEFGSSIYSLLGRRVPAKLARERVDFPSRR